jgi:hypothetical protein
VISFVVFLRFITNFCTILVLKHHAMKIHEEVEVLPHTVPQHLKEMETKIKLPDCQKLNIGQKSEAYLLIYPSSCM